MGRTLGIMFTMTTYGTWLRGDQRGWVEDGVIMPPLPALEEADRKRMKHDRWLFRHEDLIRVGQAIGASLVQRQQLAIYALTVQTWHAHFVIGPTRFDVADVAKCAKDAGRYGLRAGRPLWTDGYDKRFCFDENLLHTRIRYVERHNEALGCPANPWTFVVNAPSISPR